MSNCSFLLSNKKYINSDLLGSYIMKDKQILLDNISKLNTTEMGVDIIKKNLKLDIYDIMEHCKNKGLDEKI